MLARTVGQKCTMKSGLIRYVAVAAVMLTVVDRTRTLTTFGVNKNTEEQPKPPPPKQQRGTECKINTPCPIITSKCIKDPVDHSMRCLCANKKAANNGACPQLPKFLGSVCEEDKECSEGQHCQLTSNATSATNKACMCMEGFVEDIHTCNTGYSSVLPSIASLIAAAVSILGLAMTFV